MIFSNIVKYRNDGVWGFRFVLCQCAQLQEDVFDGMMVDSFAFRISITITSSCYMISLEISASIRMNKLLEFNQSKISFIHEMQKMEGYDSFKEKPGQDFKMSIFWDDHKSMDKFINSDHYKFFHGAIITLSKENSITIHRETIKDKD